MTDCKYCKEEYGKQMKRITQAEFQKVYQGDLSNLRQKTALEPLKRQESPSEYKFAEYKLQKNVVGFLNLYYPDVNFISNPINLSLTKMQRIRNTEIQKRDFKCPDMIIFEARHGFNGLLLELKKETVYKLNGELKAGEHLAGQWQAILQLREAGFDADFYWDFETIKKKLNWYLGDK